MNVWGKRGQATMWSNSLSTIRRQQGISHLYLRFVLDDRVAPLLSIWLRGNFACLNLCNVFPTHPACCVAA
jgi:hypothetical protein